MNQRSWKCPHCNESFTRFNIHGVDMEIHSLRDLVFEVQNKDNEWYVDLAPESEWALSSAVDHSRIDVERETVLAREYMQDSEYEVTECCGSAFDVERDLATELTADPLAGALIQPDDPLPGTEPITLIQPDDPIPSRKLKYSDWHECKCGVEYTVEHYPNCPDCGLESIPENAAVPMRLEYTTEELKQHEKDADLMDKFQLALSTMARYNQIREEQGLSPIPTTLEEDDDE